MQPRIIDARSANQRLAQAAAGTISNPRSENTSEKNLMQSTECLQVPFLCNRYGPSTDTSEQTLGNTSRGENDDIEVRLKDFCEMAVTLDLHFHVSLFSKRS